MIPRIVQLCVALALLSSFCVGEVCQVIPTLSSLKEAATGNASEALEMTTPSVGDNLLECPGPDDPANYTACCYDFNDGDADEEDERKEGSAEGSGDDKSEDEMNEEELPRSRKPRCCAPKVEQNFLDWVLGLDERVAMIVALSVTGTLLLFTIIIIVCCFWSKCPLYYTCRVKYDKDDIIATAGDEETANLTDMPAEEKGVKGYSPNEVKVTTLNEEEEPCLKKEKEADEQQPLVEKKEDKKKEDKKKEEKKKEEKKKEEKKKEEKKKEEKKKEEKKKEDKKKEEKNKDEKKKEEKKEEETVDKEEKKEEPAEKKEEQKDGEKKDEENKEEK